jgi:hypothetical protein
VSFDAITLCVAPQRVFIVVVYFVIDSVRKLLDTLSYISQWSMFLKHTRKQHEHREIQYSNFVWDTGCHKIFRGFP